MSNSNPPIPGPPPISYPFETGLTSSVTPPSVTSFVPHSTLPQAFQSGFMPALATRSTIPTTIQSLNQAGPPPFLRVQLTDEERRLVICNGRNEVLRLMFTRSAIPPRSLVNSLVDETLSIALQGVVGAAVVELPESAAREMRNMIGNVWRYFQQYSLCHLHKQYGLRLPSGQSGSEAGYRDQRVRQLLSGFDFLRDHPTLPYFSSSFMEHFLLDALTISPFGLHRFVRSNNMDNLFMLAATSIIAALHDFQDGKYDPRNAENSKWHQYSQPVNRMIEQMRQAQWLESWLDGLQTNLLARAHASLQS
ncbi:hypothetical protein EV363DRAFT_1450549 [Boletus edulis]|nr:hypothetical protein EV363DRAFT_1450549 [Boletus edulis]